ncbi:MAG: hypothetical protein H7X84_12565, partial [Verrucomicrobia bacterium]|nr:hypothetical protein [Prolixibacteraceae bacterium]
MNAQQLLNEILPILHSVKEDREKLEKILQFLLDEIYEEEEEEDEMEVPEKYLKAVKEIAGGIDAGFISILNMDTLEVEDVPQGMLMDPEDYESVTGISFEEADYQHPYWKNTITFEPLDSHESFDIMRRFTERLKDQKLQAKLIYALNNRKPFAHFKYHIDNSDHR